MIRTGHAQLSDAWHQARCGLITASIVGDAVSVLTRASGDRVKDDPTAASDELAAILAIERISGVPYRKLYDTPEMREGREQEPFARMAYESRTGYLVEEVGLITTDDNRFGYSPDGMVEDDGLLEVKTLVSARRVVEFLKTGDYSEFIPQCKTGKWITGRKWIDLVIWIPQLESVGKHLNIIRLNRNDDAINELEVKLINFLRRVDDLERIFRNHAPIAMAA